MAINKKFIFILCVLGLFVVIPFSYFFAKQKNYIIDKESHIYTEVEEMTTLGKEWLKNHVQESGDFLYLYDPHKKDKKYDKNNIIRHLLAARVVAQLCKEEDKSFCEVHRRNINFFMENLYREKIEDDDVIGYMVFKNKSKLGANALMIRLLVQSPFFEEYEDYTKKLVKGIGSLQKKNGEFEPWFVEPDYAYNTQYILTFYSGEAILALMEYYEKTGSQEVYNMAKKSQDYYIEKYVQQMRRNYYPAYVPWHTFSLAKFYKKTKDEKYAQAIFILNDELIKIQDTYSYAGRFYNRHYPEYGKPHSASDGVYTESLVTAYKIALDVDDQRHQKKYYEGIELAINNLAKLQYCNSHSEVEGVDKSDCGGIRSREDYTSIRVDNVAHMMDAMLKIKEISY